VAPLDGGGDAGHPAPRSSGGFAGYGPHQLPYQLRRHPVLLVEVPGLIKLTQCLRPSILAQLPSQVRGVRGEWDIYWSIAWCAYGTPNPAPLPAHARWAERHHPGVVGEPAAGCIPSVPPRGRSARGEFLAPNSPLGPPPVLLADFWATGRARNPLGFVRWVVSIKARGRYTLCSAIHCA
jgi:hypothetical protein